MRRRRGEDERRRSTRARPSRLGSLGKPAQWDKKNKTHPSDSVFPHHDHFVDVEAGPRSVTNQLDDNNCQEQAFHRLFPPGGSVYFAPSSGITIKQRSKMSDFHSAHPTGWAESISGNGVCVDVCMYVITSKMINMTARRLHRPL